MVKLRWPRAETYGEYIESKCTCSGRNKGKGRLGIWENRVRRDSLRPDDSVGRTRYDES